MTVTENTLIEIAPADSQSNSTLNLIGLAVISATALAAIKLGGLFSKAETIHTAPKLPSTPTKFSDTAVDIHEQMTILLRELNPQNLAGWSHVGLNNGSTKVAKLAVYEQPELLRIPEQLPKIVEFDSNSKVLDTYNQAKFSIGMVEIDNKPTGSGVWIDEKEGLFLTNNHVGGGGDHRTKKIHLADGQKAYAYLVASDPVADLALLKAFLPQDAPVKALPILETNKMNSSEIMIMGFPNGASLPIISPGHIKRVEISYGEHEFRYRKDLSMKALTFGGNSGGPILHNDGNSVSVVGLVSRGYELRSTSPYGNNPSNSTAHGPDATHLSQLIQTWKARQGDMSEILMMRSTVTGVDEKLNLPEQFKHLYHTKHQQELYHRPKVWSAHTNFINNPDFAAAFNHTYPTTNTFTWGLKRNPLFLDQIWKAHYGKPYPY